MSTTQPVSISAGEQIDLTERVDLDPGGSHEIISLATPGNPVVGYQAGPDPEAVMRSVPCERRDPDAQRGREPASVLDATPELVDEVVLVDGHSIDDTVDVARGCGPTCA